MLADIGGIANVKLCTTFEVSSFTSFGDIVWSVSDFLGVAIMMMQWTKWFSSLRQVVLWSPFLQFVACAVIPPTCQI